VPNPYEVPSCQGTHHAQERISGVCSAGVADKRRQPQATCSVVIAVWSAPTSRHHTRIEVRSTLRRRVPRRLGGVAASATLRGALIPSASTQRHNGECGPVRARRGSGAAHANRWRPAPYGQARERVSKPRAGLKANGLGARRRATTPGVRVWQSPGRRRIRSASREALGSPAPLPERWKHVGVSNATARVRLSSTARANWWANPVKAWPWPGLFSTRARDCWPAGWARSQRPAAAEKAHVRSAWPSFAPEVPER
jgi:hypothetical protein